MGGATWAQQYFADLRRQSFGYWPFTEDRPADFASHYINVTDWRRRSWEAPGSNRGMPTIWLFGGSAMFGEGQRDAHTIPSDIARLAAREGRPVRAVNFGQRGWVHFQEMLLFEQQLGLHTAPDVVVFYDGPNDLQSAALFKDAVPSTLSADQFSQALRGRPLATEFRTPPPQTDVFGGLWDAYRAHSAVVKLAEATGLVSEPAGAAPADDVPDPQRGSKGEVVWGSIDDGKQGLAVYERGRFLSQSLSRRAGVEPFFFWQPVATHQDAVAYARTHLTKPTIDLTHVFDGRESDVYIDTTHTNEAGARLVAEAMWKQIEPQVRAWYRTHS